MVNIQLLWRQFFPPKVYIIFAGCARFCGDFSRVLLVAGAGFLRIGKGISAGSSRIAETSL
jgi:hypothetical protein